MVRMSDILKKAKERKAEGKKRGTSAEIPEEQPQSQLPESLPPQRPQAEPKQPSPTVEKETEKEKPETEEKIEAQSKSETKISYSEPKQPSPTVEKETEKEKPETEEKIEAQSKSETKISYSALGGLRLLNEEESIKLYRDTISSVKDVYDKAETDQEVAAESENITIHVEKLVNQQCLGNNNILNLINLPTDSDFIYTHVVNVCILSVEIGLGLEYDKAQLVELGTIAVVHDIGMVKFRDLYKLPRKLSEHEYKRIKRHPEIGAEILEKFKGIYKKAISVVYQEHERVDGSGYPRGLRNGAINEYTKIIGVADVYEALTHSRPHRVKNYAPESLKQIINMKNSFEKKILKVLLERIGCPFSFGTYVKLNSREKGKIVKRNIKFPFRPIVEITYDSNGQMREKTKTIDLTKCPALYIAGFLKSEEI